MSPMKIVYKIFPPPWHWIPNFKRIPPSPTTVEQKPHHACERAKSELDLAHKSAVVSFNFDGIKGWFHIDILRIYSIWYLFMAQIKFSLIKKLNIGHPEQSSTPYVWYVYQPLPGWKKFTKLSFWQLYNA